MANPIILHCFDEDYNIMEERVSKLFKNMRGVIDTSLSTGTMFKMLSSMDLDEMFIIKHLDRLDISSLIIRKTLTVGAFEERIETILKFILDSNVATLDERFALVRLFMIETMSTEQISENVFEFMNIMKHQIDVIVESDEELDEYSEACLDRIYRTNGLFVSSFYELIITTDNPSPYIFLFGASLVLYETCNPNAIPLEKEEVIDITETDVIQAISIFPSLLTEKKYRAKLTKLLTTFDIAL